MRNGSFSFLVIIISFSLFFSACHETTTPPVDTEPEVVEKPLPPFVGELYGIPRGDYLIDTVILPANSLLESFLRSQRVSESHLRGLGFRIDSVFSVRGFRAGRAT